MLGTRLAGIVAAAALLGAGACGRDSDEKMAGLDQRLASIERTLAAMAPPKPAKPEASANAVVHGDWRAIPLDPAAEKGLRWLVSVQGTDGGWGQDGGRTMDPREGVALESKDNDVANTSIAALALLRTGSTPKEGPYAEALRKAVGYILAHVEESPAEGLDVTSKQGTQIQRKLGKHIDTFLATRVLSQVDGRMPDDAVQARVHAAVAKCVAKIQKHQGADGSWNDPGSWAPVLSTSMASRSLREAESAGVAIDESKMARVDHFTASNYDAPSGRFSAAVGGGGSAGVELYQLGQTLEQVSRDEDARAANGPMIEAAAGMLSEARVVSGFGSMGGEEFVSYMNVSDSLRRTGGDPWTKWNTKIKTHVLELQNADGTWAGHHCITGRVACTGAAVLTLLAERTGPRQD